MWAFRAEFIATRATDFIGMIKDCDEAGFPKVRHIHIHHVLQVCSKNSIVAPPFCLQYSFYLLSALFTLQLPLFVLLQHLLFGSLGRSLACADPPEAERLPILNEAWKVITKVRSPQVHNK